MLWLAFASLHCRGKSSALHAHSRSTPIVLRQAPRPRSSCIARTPRCAPVCRSPRALLWPPVAVLIRDPAAEQAALERIAAGAFQFTSVVSIAPPAEVLLEIGGSLRLFGGLSHLWTCIEQELEAQGYTASIACAPTPLAAQFFARAGLPWRKPATRCAQAEAYPSKSSIFP